MPKMKSHSGASKRFRVTGSGKIMRERSGRRHLMERKSSKLARGLEGTAEVAKADVKRVRKLLSS